MISFPIVLASASPRRLQLLKQIGMKPTVKVADIDERVSGSETPEEYACRLACAKGKTVVDRYGDDPAVISADTIVVVDRSILGKPGNRQEAGDFMRLLSGREHTVTTAVSIFWKSRSLTRCESTKVLFAPLSETMINAYLDTGDYLDKAGGYGIQSFAALFIPRIEGCFFNVMGFPLYLFSKMALEMGLPIFI